MKRKHAASLTLAGCMSVLLLLVTAHPADSQATEVDPFDAKCELGITLAMAGQTASAESVFISLLSEVPGDSRPYVNLGNVHFLRGDLDVALVFYDMAVGKDSTDAGIHLNRATTLMLKGEDEAARSEAALAIEMAGGEKNASALIGLKETQMDSEKASDKTYVSKQEVRELLSGAMIAPPEAAAVTDSVGTASDSPENSSGKKRSKLWGSSAPRAADDTEAAAVLYWKY